MRVRVTAVLGTDPVRVRFSCDAGEATARWAGDVPEPGSEHAVELDVDAPLRWGVRAGPAPVGAAWGQATGLVEDAGPDVLLRGRITDVGVDDVTVVVGGTPVVVDLEGAPADLAGRLVELRVPELVLWPFSA